LAQNPLSVQGSLSSQSVPFGADDQVESESDGAQIPQSRVSPSARQLPLIKQTLSAMLHEQEPCLQVSTVQGKPSSQFDESKQLLVDVSDVAIPSEKTVASALLGAGSVPHAPRKKTSNTMARRAGIVMVSPYLKVP
jgi:hypothetical protein